MQTFIEESKTLFTFTDEMSEKSTLTFDKHVADSLHTIVGDVHSWIQQQYDGIIAGDKRYVKYINAVVLNNGELTRLAIGNIIRLVASMLIIENVDF